MTGPFDLALVNEARTHPDPEGAMAVLEAEAGRDYRHMFPLPWESLVLVLNGPPPAKADTP